MVLKYNFKGLMAPVFTPFTSNFQLNLNLIPEYASHLKRCGINGVLVNGTSGEGVSMSLEERRSVVEVWMKEAKMKDLTVMVQVGGAPLNLVKEMAKHAEIKGATAILCLPDLFFKPKSETELITYLQQVGEAAPNTPLFYYHIPSFTSVYLDMGHFLEEAYSNLKTLSGIKFTHTDLEQGARCINACSKAYTVFLGADQVTSGAAILGFDSAISTTLNMFPEHSQKILEAVESGKNDDAARTQNELTKYISLITSKGSWVSSMKAAMKIKTGLDFGPPRPPLVPLTDKQVSTLTNEIC